MFNLKYERLWPVEPKSETTVSLALKQQASDGYISVTLFCRVTVLHLNISYVNIYLA